jgi:hypothetical protein
MTTKPAPELGLEPVKKLDLMRTLERHLGRTMDLDLKHAEEPTRTTGTRNGN